ncbi:MAG: RluA family pseudouridine synthase [Oscillospiraceae bacterium]|nr:RluA family pseudouridine synthase [Oscillospiraceae bacterium]
MAQNTEFINKRGKIFIKKIIANKNDANQRLDKFLAKTFGNLPPSMLYKFIRAKKIKVNGKRCAIGYKLNEGDIIDLYIKDEFLVTENHILSFKDIIPKLKILYEDGNILLCDKKPGVIVHPDKNEEINTLINHITAYLYKKGEYNPEFENSFAPALCNRIDRNTGGIVICAKNSETLRIINEKIKNNEIEKKYLCLINGILDKKSGIMTAYHRKNQDLNIAEINKNKFPGSKIIKTGYEVLGEKNNISLVEVELITGRTHQIRAHFAYIGRPLVGDGKYNKNKTPGFFHQALYAYKIKFNFTGESGVLDYLNGKIITAGSVGEIASRWKF